MSLTAAEVRFLSFTVQDKFCAQIILDSILSAYEGSALEGIAVLSSNRDSNPHLVHAFQAFTLTLTGGWSICVYRNGGKGYWQVQQVCTSCTTSKVRVPNSYMSKWESLYSPTENIEILSCGFCGYALASPNTGVHFTFNSDAFRGFEIDPIEEQLVDQDPECSVLAAVGEADELRCLLRRLITVADNTVFWAQPDRLGLLVAPS